MDSDDEAAAAAMAARARETLRKSASSSSSSPYARSTDDGPVASTSCDARLERCCREVGAAVAVVEEPERVVSGGGALPEFVGEGGGEGIYRVPLRAAMHPGRPPPLEVRPHPLRETQVGSFLRALACEPRRRQLWAGSESGVRVWGLDDVFAAAGCGARRGDEESAPFRESVPVPPVLCVEADAANALVWTGHKDGRIMSWRMDLAAGSDDDDAPLFREALTWQAHSRTPVLSMVITSYGEKLDYLL